MRCTSLRRFSFGLLAWFAAAGCGSEEQALIAKSDPYIPNQCLIEVCDDGVDNDNNGAVDCGDPDCIDEPDCLGCAFTDTTLCGVYRVETMAFGEEAADACDADPSKAPCRSEAARLYCPCGFVPRRWEDNDCFDLYVDWVRCGPGAILDDAGASSAASTSPELFAPKADSESELTCSSAPTTKRFEPNGGFTNFPINPKWSMLRREPPDMPSAAQPLDLRASNFVPGQWIEITQLGDYADGDAADGGSIATSNTIAAFSESPTLNSSNESERIPGAIDLDVDNDDEFLDLNIVTEPADIFGPTDIPEDFKIADACSGGCSVDVRIPLGAEYLFATAIDDRYDDNTDGDSDFELSIQRKSLPVPWFYQCDSRWQNRAWEGASSVPNDTWCNKACSMMTGTAVMAYYGVRNPADCTPLDPRDVYDYFRQDIVPAGTNGNSVSYSKGFVGYGVKWSAFVELARESNLNCDTQKVVRDVASKFSSSAVQSQLLFENRPVILYEPGHFVIATGIDFLNTPETFYIVDPGHQTRYRLTHPSYSNSAEGILLFKETNTDYSRFDFAVPTPATIVVTDPDGRRTGIVDDVVVEDIPGSAYVFEEEVYREREPGELPGNPPSPGTGFNNVYITEPAAGTYSVEVFAPDTGMVDVLVDRSPRQGGATFDVFVVEAGPDGSELTTYDYDPGPELPPVSAGGTGGMGSGGSSTGGAGDAGSDPGSAGAIADGPGATNGSAGGCSTSDSPISSGGDHILVLMCLLLAFRRRRCGSREPAS